MLTRTIIIQDGKYHLESDYYENTCRIVVFFMIIIASFQAVDSNVAIYLMILFQTISEYSLREQVVYMKKSEVKSKWKQQYRQCPSFFFALVSWFFAYLNHDPEQMPNTFILVSLGFHQFYQSMVAAQKIRNIYTNRVKLNTYKYPDADYV